MVPKAKSKTNHQRLDILLREFLEEEIKREDLISDPKKIDYYWEVLEDNLWGNKMDLNEFAQNIADSFDNFLIWDDLEEVEIFLGRTAEMKLRHSDEIVDPSNIQERNASLILYFHRILNSFWADYWKRVVIQNTLRDYPLDKKIEILEREGKYQGFPGGNAVVHSIDPFYTFNDDGTPHFFYGGTDALRDLKDILGHVSVYDFKKCKDNVKCGKWFVVTSKHPRDFCCHRCAARYTERIKRETNPEEFKKFHKKYYHDNYAIGKKEAEESN